MFKQILLVIQLVKLSISLWNTRSIFRLHIMKNKKTLTFYDFYKKKNRLKNADKLSVQKESV